MPGILENLQSATVHVVRDYGLRWLGSLVRRASDLRFDCREFDSRPLRPVLGWVTVFRPANHLSIFPSHLGQLRHRYMSDDKRCSLHTVCTIYGEVTLSGTENEYRPKCGDALRLGSKGRYGSLHNVRVAGKLCDPSLTCAMP